MPIASLKARTLTPEENEEFLQKLYKGGELLASGNVVEAKEHLEHAYKIQPKNEKGQNLLGLTYFKLGQFDRASEIYEALVRENPADPTLRVNLGLVYLKASSTQRAIREFETATDLAPEHTKAHNYLGLALAQAGEYGKAREHFLLAGSPAMAEKMARAIAGEGFTPKPPTQAMPPPPSEPEKALNGTGAHLDGAESEQQHHGEANGAYVGEANGAGEESYQAPPEEQAAESYTDEQYAGEPPPVHVEDPAQLEALSPPLGGEEELPDTSSMRAPDAESEMDWHSLDQAQSAAVEQAPAEEPAAEEMPVYDLATDADILEKDEGAPVGISAGTGLDASFAPDPAEAANADAVAADGSNGYLAEEAFSGYYDQASTDAPPPAAEDPVVEASTSAEVMITEEPLETPESAFEPPEVPKDELQAETVPPVVPEVEAAAPVAEEPVAVAEEPEQHAEPGPPLDSTETPTKRFRTRIDVQASVADAEPEVDAAIFAEVAEKARLFNVQVRGPFEIKDDTISVVVKDEMITRLSGLLAMSGSIELTPEHKRFRGRATDKGFGEGEEQMMRAKGSGVLVIESKHKLFSKSDLNDESAYFREDVVFAFEEPVMYENGNVPSDVAQDLQLIHLRGKGQVLLCLDGPLRSLDVKLGAPVTVPLGHLVGWYGNLSPRVIALVSDGKGKALKAGVELSGEGFALLAVPQR